MFKKFRTMAIAMVLAFALVPSAAFADESADSVQIAIGSVHTPKKPFNLSLIKFGPIIPTTLGGVTTIYASNPYMVTIGIVSTAGTPDKPGE